MQLNVGRQTVETSGGNDHVEFAQLLELLGANDTDVLAFRKSELRAFKPPAVRLKHCQEQSVAVFGREQRLRQRREPDLQDAERAILRPQSLVADQQSINGRAGLARRNVRAVVEIERRLGNDRIRAADAFVLADLLGKARKRSRQQQLAGV